MKDKEGDGMNDLRKAAEMALEALERLDRWLALRYGQELTQPEKDVVEALRQALAHEALDRMVAENQSLGLYDDAASYTKLDTTAGVLHKEKNT